METKIRLNERSLASLPIPTDRPQLYFSDTELPGFGVVVGKTGRRTFIVRGRNAQRKQEKRAIGVAGAPRDSDGHVWNVQLARIEARKMLGAIAEGKTPAPLRQRAAADGPTLGEILDLHRDRMRREGKQPRSIEEFKRETEKHLEAWIKRPLVTITRAECRERHAELSDASGIYLANRVMRFLRAAWNTALKEHETLPISPTIGVHWNKEHRRQEPVPWEKLPATWKAIEALANGVRRDYYKTLLLTGLRKMDAATIRWEHLNTTDKPLASKVWNQVDERWEDIELPPLSLLRPNPKGGADRAFFVPLTAKLVEILERRRRENVTIVGGDDGWAFPAETWKEGACHECTALGQPEHKRGRHTHLIEPREEGIASPHRLRDTYTTALAALKEPPLSPFVIDVLTNHRPPRGSVTAGYIDLSIDDLRGPQDRATAFLDEKCTAQKSD